MAEEIKTATNQLVALFDETIALLSPFAINSDATKALYDESESVRMYGRNLLSTESVTPLQANTFTAAVKSFDRHLSEVEQAVYEEIGGESLDKLITLLNEKATAYNLLTNYAKEK